jgi:hypothetical protein
VATVTVHVSGDDWLVWVFSHVLCASAVVNVQCKRVNIHSYFACCSGQSGWGQITGNVILFTSVFVQTNLHFVFPVFYIHLV